MSDRRRQRHPYEAYEQEAIWAALDRAMRALAKNGDVDERTSHEHIVGYLAKSLTEAGFKRVSELRTGGRTLHVVEVRERPDDETPRKRAGAA